MRFWQRLVVAFSVLPITITCHAFGQVECSSPNELSAASVVKEIQSVCVLAKQATPDGDVLPVVSEEINNSIKMIGGKLDAPNPFGRCWWDSRFDCLKAKEAVVTLGDQIAAFEDSHYLSAAAANRAKPLRDATIEARDSAVPNIHSYCNTLRH